jgi:hypothetical protein
MLRRGVAGDGLFQEPIIVRVAADPEQMRLSSSDGECPVRSPMRSEPSNAFEVKRWVLQFCLSNPKF